MSITVFFSYAHEDEALRDKLANHLSILKRSSTIEAWHDRQILPGTEWDKQINTHLETADIILLLISADFLASDYCWDVEVARAMVRHEAGEACVIPIILRSCDWMGASFGKLQGLPKDMRPVTAWEDMDSAFTDIAQGIRRRAEELVLKQQSRTEDAHLSQGMTSPKLAIDESDRKSNTEQSQNAFNISNSSITNLVGSGSIHYSEAHKQSNGSLEPNSPKKLILFLAAQPIATARLRLDEEVREIEAGLQRSKHSDRFELRQQWAVRPRDLQRAMLDCKPQIVHFSGHGVGRATADSQSSEGTRKLIPVGQEAFEEGLILEDQTGQAKLVTTEALAALFELFVDSVECVVLNACYSERQASAIAQHIPYVIGMNQAIGDQAAIEFAIGFYDALGAGESIKRAYDIGVLAIKMAGIPEHSIPKLLSKTS